MRAALLFRCCFFGKGAALLVAFSGQSSRRPDGRFFFTSIFTSIPFIPGFKPTPHQSGDQSFDSRLELTIPWTEPYATSCNREVDFRKNVAKLGHKVQDFALCRRWVAPRGGES
jgi:hypothetical protein